MTTTDIRLTDTERLVLALIGSRGAEGITTWGPKSHPRLEDYTAETEALQSLLRFDLVTEQEWPLERIIILTEEGQTRFEQSRKYAARYSECPGCTLLNCVCSYRMGCLAVSDPLAQKGNHIRLGCNGTHD
jgi:hypothetical protein